MTSVYVMIPVGLNSRGQKLSKITQQDSWKSGGGDFVSLFSDIFETNLLAIFLSQPLLS